MSQRILPVNLPGISEKIYAGFWRRLGAFCIDLLIIIPINIAIVYCNRFDKNYYFYTIIPAYLFYFIYDIYFIKLWVQLPVSF